MAKTKKTKRVKHSEPTAKRMGRPPNKLAIDRALVEELVGLVGTAIAGVSEPLAKELDAGKFDACRSRLREIDQLMRLASALQLVMKGGKQ